MKTIREAEYHSCPTCDHRTKVKEPCYGCGHCGKEIDLAKRHTDYLEATVFWHTSQPQHIYLCCVACVIGWVQSFKPTKEFDFMSLPLLSGAAKIRQLRKHLR